MILPAITDNINELLRARTAQGRSAPGFSRPPDFRRLPDLFQMRAYLVEAAAGSTNIALPDLAFLEVKTHWLRPWSVQKSQQQHANFVFRLYGDVLALRLNSYETVWWPVPDLCLSLPCADPTKHVLKHVLYNCWAIQAEVRAHAQRWGQA